MFDNYKKTLHTKIIKTVAHDPKSIDNLTDNKDFWHMMLVNYEVSKKKIFYRLYPQPLLTDKELYLGMIFFCLIKTSDKFLFTAMNKLHSYHANAHYINLLIANKQSDNLKSFLLNSKDSLILHGTPGFLLLTQAYYNLAQEDINFQPQFWQNLTVAQKLFKYSQASIHNAYFGDKIKVMKCTNFEQIFAKAAKSLSPPKNINKYVELECQKYISALRAEKKRIKLNLDINYKLP